MPYYYFKAMPSEESPIQTWLKTMQERILRVIPNALIVIGATAVLTVAYPMISYQRTSQKWQQNQASSLLNSQNDNDKMGIGDTTQPVQAYQENTQAEIVDGIDYMKAENWFLGEDYAAKKSTQKYTPVTSYTISVPVLNIKEMIVEIGGDSLDKHLIQYPGTALPGQYGNPVIFGHSVLPVFYNPKSYMSVFSKLPTLKKGDEIFVNYDGIEYRYAVESYHEVRPDQVDVLEQRYDRQTITLITCVPPGTYSKRGVIMGILEKL